MKFEEMWYHWMTIGDYDMAFNRVITKLLIYRSQTAEHIGAYEVCP